MAVDIDAIQMKKDDEQLRHDWYWRIASAMTPTSDGGWRMAAIWSKPKDRDFHTGVDLLSTGNGFELAKFRIHSSI